ncbi:hypothetical protein STENM36S_07145 [Streptomyces tendae]
MQRVSEEKRLLGGEEAVGSAAVSRTVAVTFGSGSFRTVPEEYGGAADGVGDARDEVGTVGPRGTGRLAREQRGERDRVHGRRRVGGAGQPRGAEAVPAGRGPVVHGNDEGRTGGRERNAEDAVVGGGHVGLAGPAADQVLRARGLRDGVRFEVGRGVGRAVAGERCGTRAGKGSLRRFSRPGSGRGAGCGGGRRSRFGGGVGVQRGSSWRAVSWGWVSSRGALPA